MYLSFFKRFCIILINSKIEKREKKAARNVTNVGTFPLKIKIISMIIFIVLKYKIGKRSRKKETPKRKIINWQIKERLNCPVTKVSGRCFERTKV